MYIYLNEYMYALLYTLDIFEHQSMNIWQSFDVQHIEIYLNLYNRPLGVY